MDRLREYIFDLNTLDKDNVKNRFDNLDSAIFKIISFMIKHTKYVQPKIHNILYVISSGTDHNRLLFFSTLPKDTHDYFRDVRRVDFLERAIPLACSEDDPAAYIEFLKKAAFLRLVYEEIIVEFLEAGELFFNLDSEYVKAHNALLEGSAIAAKKFVVLADKLNKVVEEIGADRSELFYIFSKVKYLFYKYNEYRHTLLLPFLRVVFTEANHKVSESVSLEDNFQNGYFGLVRASTIYDQTIGVPFGTYAQCWVKQRILSNLSTEGNIIKIPQIIWQKAAKESSNGENSCYTSITERSVVYSLDDAGPDSSDNKALYQMLEDKDSSVDRFENNYFLQKVIVSMAKKWSPLEKTIVFLRHGMLDYLEEKRSVSDLSEIAEIVHQLFEAQDIL